MVAAKVVWIFLLFEMSKAQITLQPGITLPPVITPVPGTNNPITNLLASPTTVATTTPVMVTTIVNTVAPPTSTTSTTTFSPIPPSTLSSTTTPSPIPPSIPSSTTTLSPIPPSTNPSSSTINTTTPSLPITTPFLPPFITPKPMRNFTIFLVFPNLTDKVPNLFEINETVANALKASLATKLGVDVASISNNSDIQLTNGGKEVKIVKRSAEPPPNNEVTLQFDLTSSNYITSDEVKNKLLNSGPFQIFNLNVSDPLVYVWADVNSCQSRNCSSGTTCTVTSNSTTSRSYQLNCSPVTQSNTNSNQPGGPNLFYLLLLLLLIPIAILIAVGFYCYQRNPGRNHLVNSYPREKLQAKFSNHPFGTTKSGKSDIIIMGGEGPPTYETNPKSTVRTHGGKVGTVASMHAFSNQAFDEQEKGHANGNSVVSNHAPVEGDDSMTFSYMQMRNSKVKDDTMALF